METPQITEERLAAYLRGELSAAETAEIEAWYDASPANRRTMGEVYRILCLNDRLRAAEEVDVERSLRAVRSRMRSGRRSALRRLVWRSAAAAAVVLLVVGLSLEVRTLAGRLERPVVVYTDLGERSQVELPDGTKVWLNSSSRVEYRSPLFSRERRVTMSGEAYFEVAHDASSPFIVTSNGLDVRVLGTKFNIRDDASRHRVTTVLLEGAVAASVSGGGAREVNLRPSQVLVFDTDTKNMQLHDCAAAENSIEWIEGRFRFEQDTFEEIVAELERYYNVEVRFMDDRLRSERFSGDFHLEDGIYHIMSVLQLTYKFHYKVNRDNIELYAN